MMRNSLFIVCPFLFCAANSFSSEFATKNLCCKGRLRCACAWLAFVALVSALLSWLFGLARLLAQRAFLSLLCVCLRLRCATCHFERSEKSTLSFCGYFANAQYDKQTLLLWLAFCRSALALSYRKMRFLALLCVCFALALRHLSF